MKETPNQKDHPAAYIAAILLIMVAVLVIADWISGVADFLHAIRNPPRHMGGINL